MTRIAFILILEFTIPSFAERPTKLYGGLWIAGLYDFEERAEAYRWNGMVGCKIMTKLTPRFAVGISGAASINEGTTNSHPDDHYDYDYVRADYFGFNQFGVQFESDLIQSDRRVVTTQLYLGAGTERGMRSYAGHTYPASWIVKYFVLEPSVRPAFCLTPGVRAGLGFGLRFVYSRAGQLAESRPVEPRLTFGLDFGRF